MPANGFHSNGYSLIRHILATKKLDLGHTYQELGRSLGEELLRPTQIYTRDCLVLIKVLGTHLRTFAHITGGGLAANTARVIPSHLTARFDRATWALPVATELLATLGGVQQVDYERTWNCGVGMVALIAPEQADLALATLAARGMHAWIAGEVTSQANPQGATLEGSHQAR